MMVSQSLVVVGVEVGKSVCMVSVHGRTGVVKFTPDAPGISSFLGLLAELEGEVRVGLEATGGYEAALWEVVEGAGFHVRQLAPARVHAYARSVGRLTKTDRYDAVTIAAYLAANPEAGRRLPPANVRQIRALFAKRRQLVEMAKALACQKLQARDPVITAMDDAHMALIEARIAALEVEAAAVIDADPGLAERRRLLRTIPGIGAITSVTLLAEMPELGTMPTRAAAALAGLAPFARDSGTASGKRFIRGGRRVVRGVLYMAALSASSCNPSLKPSLNPSLKPFAQRLKAAHKPGKLTLTAVARKLIETANAVLKRQADWREI